jgi:hypothetical protein
MFFFEIKKSTITVLEGMWNAFVTALGRSKLKMRCWNGGTALPGRFKQILQFGQILLFSGFLHF